MKRSEEIVEYLRREGRKAPIPEGIEPEQMRRRLELYNKQVQKEGKAGGDAGIQKEKAVPEEGQTGGLHSRGRHGIRNRMGKWKRYYKPLMAVACLCLALRVAVVWQQGFFGKLPLSGSLSAGQEMESEEGLAGEGKPEETTGTDFGEAKEMEAGDWGEALSGEERKLLSRTTYEELYASMSGVWESAWQTDSFKDSSLGATDDVSRDNSMKMQEKAEASAVADLAFGTTNVQTAGVDEGAFLKNDGRYLYQTVINTEAGKSGQEVQILDTKEGLRELCRLGGFEQIAEIYVWQDLLVVIENKYQDYFRGVETSRKFVCEDVAGSGNGYHEISFYQITDRENPRKIKTFTLQGSYLSSRIADGYFYGISRYYAHPGEGEKDYDAYVPRLDGKRLLPGEICVPRDSTGSAYLVLVSIDLSEPSAFSQTLGVIAGGDLYYMSQDNIYVADYRSPYARREEGADRDSTAILRFSYDQGKFYLRATGEIPGRLNDSFSLDEYNGYLRAVSTVKEFWPKKIVDDRTGQVVGYDIREGKQANGLYVLDEKLDIVGKIQDLAEDEEIYSARFLKDAGYFVTFRQTDPLFAVDLSEPENPRLLGELKVSGFSEYLHFYGADRLLGIGMETDETGRQTGVKLSMFDISIPEDLKEIARLVLTDYDYSPALYDHREVLIHTGENIFGFEAVGNRGGQHGKDYLVFSYEKDAFVEKLVLDTKNKEGDYYCSRGTFIGDMFYLLLEDGTVRSYDRHTGALMEGLGE